MYIYDILISNNIEIESSKLSEAYNGSSFNLFCFLYLYEKENKKFIMCV